MCGATRPALRLYWYCCPPRDAFAAIVGSRLGTSGHLHLGLPNLYKFVFQLITQTTFSIPYETYDISHMARAHSTQQSFETA
jgi:hypothetical protein